MSKRYLGAIAVGAGLTLVPISVRSHADDTMAKLAVSEACAMGGECCRFSLGDICLLGDELLIHYRSNGGSCIKPGS
jgi:hypothetical protein